MTFGKLHDRRRISTVIAFRAERYAKLDADDEVCTAHCGEDWLSASLIVLLMPCGPTDSRTDRQGCDKDAS